MPPPGYTGRRAGLSNSYEPLNRRTPQQRDCSRLSPERRAFPFGGCPRLSRRARRAFRMDICHSALTRRCVFASLYARELWAGAMLCLAGFSSGRSLGARGGCSARRCGSVAALCGRFTSAMRSCWNVLCSITPAVCRMSAKQDGLRNVAFLFRSGSRSPVVRSRVAVRLSGLAGSLRVCAFLYGDPDGGRRDAGNGVGGAV